mmetsp:Transcript_45517/g.114541  ORF Transcript_45517/g.114541 Transcript_45517/m.114541 type:complete len:265 (+) Transcript_45517:137-931(+)
MLQEYWTQLVEWWPYSERTLFMVGTWLVHFVTFWGFNLILEVIYRFDLLKRWKIPHKKPADPELVRSCTRKLLLHHLVVQWPMLYVLYSVFAYFGTTSAPEAFPSLFTIVWQFALFIVVNDGCFYWAHRALHHPRIYKYIHKQHHEFKASVGVASEYAHPIEELLANLTPTLLAPILCGTHMFTLWLWTLVRTLETVDAHSGYNLPFSPFYLLPFVGGADRHDFHHSHNVGTYGAFFTFWDDVMGTSDAYLQYKKKLAATKKNE